MITLLSKKLADFLCRKDIIDCENKEIYQYGYELLISDIIAFLLLTAAGILAHLIIETYVFYATIVLIRQFCGGFHASTYFKCNLTTLIIYALVMLMSQLLTEHDGVAGVNIILLGFYFVTAFAFAPVENKNKPLDAKKKIRARRMSFILGGIFSAASMGLLFVYERLSLVVSLTLSAVAMLMVIERYRNEEEFK